MPTIDRADRRRTLTYLATLGVPGAAWVAPAVASDFPTRPITIVSPFPANGFGGVFPKLVAEQLRKAYGQPVVVDARPGASTMVGTQYAAKARPDGYTLLLTYPSFLINPSLYPKSGYDPLKDFVPVAHLVNLSSVLVVGSRLGINSWADYIQHAKANPGKLSLGFSGSGSTAHIVSRMINDVAGVDILHVQYKGELQALNDIYGGTLDSCYLAAGTYRAQLSTGKIRGIAVTGQQRIPQAPDVPTFTELRVPAGQIWFGLFAPTGTPREVVQSLAEKANASMQQPEVKATVVDSLGANVVDSTQPRFAAMLDQDLRMWREAIEKYRITAD